MATYKGGVTFDGDPDEIVFASPATIYQSMPDEASEWKFFFDRLIGYSEPGQYWKKGQLWDYVLNVYARFFLPQYTFQPITFYEAAHYFLLADDLRPDNNLAPDAVLGQWSVTATAHFYDGTTNEAEPCFNRYRQSSYTYTYFGYSPSSHKAFPYPVSCKEQVVHFEIEQRVPGRVLGFNNDAFIGRDDRGNTSTWCSGGGITAELDTLEVTEGGLLFVSLPRLPEGLLPPPPLVGRVVDYGQPGPAGPPGPPGPPGEDGQAPSGDSMVSAICSLSGGQKADILGCLGVPDMIPSYVELVAGASGPEIEAAQQIIIEEAPSKVLPTTEVVLIEEGEAEMIASALPGGGWKILLLLPIAGLLAMKAIMQDISVFSCGENGEPTTKQISFPVLSIGDATQKEVWQELFKQLSFLLQCCKPCESFDWFLWRTEAGNQIFFPENDFKAMRLVCIENPDPEINKWYGDFSIRKFGIVRWLFAVEEHSTSGGGATSDTALMFWNTDDQIFVKPPGDVTGFEVSQEYAKQYQIWLLPEPATASGIKL